MNGRILLVVCAALLLSGCVDCSAPFNAHDVPADAPSTAKAGDRSISVTVLDDVGSAPAALVAWWVVPESQADADGPLVLELLQLRSESGRFEAQVPSNRNVHLTAVTDSDHTQEWVLDAFPAGNEAASITVRVYQRQLTVEISENWQGGATSTCNVDDLLPCVGTAGEAAAWNPSAIRFHEDDAINQGYLERLTDFSGQLDWANTATDRAAFALALGTSSEDIVCRFDTGAENPTPQTYREQFQLPQYDNEGSPEECTEVLDWPMERVNPGTVPTHVGPAATALAAPVNGVDYTITLNGRFWNWGPVLDMCSGYGDRSIQLEDARSGRSIEMAPAPTDGEPNPSREPNTTLAVVVGSLAGVGIVVLVVLGIFTARRQG